MTLKTSGFNLVDLEKPNKDIDSMFNIEENMNIMQEKPKKKKIKFNFDNLFPAPKNNKSMGLDDFGNQSNAFEGVI